MVLGMEVGLGPAHIVLDGDQDPPETGAQPPQFSSHVCCGQTAVCITIPLGMEVGLTLGDIVLDVVAAQPPVFGPCLLWPRPPISATADLLFVV